MLRVGDVDDVPRAVRRRLQRRRALADAAGADRRPLRVGARLDLHPEPAVLRAHHDGDRRRSRDITGARVLALLGDSITTDHISPAGSIKKDSPAGQVPDRARRAAARLQLVRRAPRQPRSDDARHVREHPPAQSARARHRRRLDDLPAGRRRDDDLRRRDEVQGRRRAARHPRRQGIRIRIVARLGGEGHAAARRQRRHRRELRAHPPQQPRQHGRAAAAVPGRRVRGVARR